MIIRMVKRGSCSYGIFWREKGYRERVRERKMRETRWEVLSPSVLVREISIERE